MIDLLAIQKRLKIAKNRKAFGIDYTNDLIKIVKEYPNYVLVVLDDQTDYFIDEIRRVELEENDKRVKGKLSSTKS